MSEGSARVGSAQRQAWSESERQQIRETTQQHQVAIDALETLLLYCLQSDTNTSQLEEMFQRERRRVEGYVYREKAKQTQRRITEFLHHS